MFARLNKKWQHRRNFERSVWQRLGQRYATVRVNGYWMTFDLHDTIISDWLFIRRIWEPYESSLMQKVLKPGSTFVDIGAHIGYYSLLAARRLGRHGHVLSFEPAPDNYPLLARNIRQNWLRGVVHTENVALADRSGEATLYLSDVNNGDHRVHPTTPEDDILTNWGRPRKQVQVPLISLDEYLRKHPIGPIDVIKMDVQGAELKVLQGMQATLQQNPNLILFMEYWTHGLKLAGTNPLDLLRFLNKQAGMALIHILPEEKRLAPITVEDLAAREFHPDIQVDLICSRDPGPLLAKLMPETA